MGDVFVFTALLHEALEKRATLLDEAIVIVSDEFLLWDRGNVDTGPTGGKCCAKGKELLEATALFEVSFGVHTCHCVSDVTTDLYWVLDCEGSDTWVLTALSRDILKLINVFNLELFHVLNDLRGRSVLSTAYLLLLIGIRFFLSSILGHILLLLLLLLLRVAVGVDLDGIFLIKVASLLRDTGSVVSVALRVRVVR